MKKNRMMRLASVLLVAVLMTTCTISGTFAKYVTQEQTFDSARVAKWGVAITATGNDAFAETYDTGDSEKDVISSESTVNVVAPGTDGKLATVTITGTPEVRVNVKKEATLTLSGWNVDGAFYCPLIIAGVDGSTFNNAADFIDAVEAVVECDKEYAPGTNLATTDNVDVDWSWPFYVDTVKDGKDTALGNLAASGNAPVITFALVTTITQVGD